MVNQLAFSIVKQLALAVAPDNMAFLNDSKKYTIQEFKESQELKKLVEPGDIVITRTPGPLHASIRKIYNMIYDHLAIIIDSESILHIAPPKVRLLSSNVLLMKKRHPLILRMNIPKEEKTLLISELLKCVGDDYNYIRVMKLSGSVLLYKVIGQEPNFHKKILEKNLKNKQTICSDLIVYASMDASPIVRKFIEKSFKSLVVSKYGSFSPDDFKVLSELSGTFLKKIYETPLTPLVENESKLSIYSDKIVNNIQLLRKIREIIQQNDHMKHRFVSFLKIVKYLAMYEMIPFQKELIFKLIPLNKRIVEFVLLFFQLRELYKDNSKLTIKSQILQKLFPVLFLLGNKVLGKDEVELLLKKLEDIKFDKIVNLFNKVLNIKGKL